MIVDVHTHFFDPDRAFGDCLKADMRQCGIDPQAWAFTPEQYESGTASADVAVVFGLEAEATGWHGDNETVRNYCGQHRDRLIFFASIDPQRHGFMDELVRCHQDWGCQGVKVGPIYQGVHPLDERYYDIYRYCSQHQLPIMTHMATTFTRGVPLEFARPAHMDQVAVDFPDLKIILAHLGHPWEPETIAIIRRHRNVFSDVSALYYRPWQYYNSMRLLVEYGPHHKVFLGSDFPATTTQQTIEGLRRINDTVAGTPLPGIPQEVIESIIQRDTLGVLGLQLPSAKGAK